MDNLDPPATLGTQETRQRQTEKLKKEESHQNWVEPMCSRSVSMLRI